MRWAGLLSVGLLVACTTPGNSKPGPRYVDGLRVMDTAEVQSYNLQLQRFFDSLLLRQGFSGGIVVAKNGQVLYEHYQGFSDEGQQDTVHAHTPFHIASTSKTFTSTAILQLAQQGKLSLDDSLQSFFPQFPYSGITVRHLLNHSSGLPNYAYLFPKYKWDSRKQASNTDVLHLFYSYRPRLDFATGTRFNYCNTNFVLLALIVEKVTGRSFPDYVSKEIFARCGMMDSYVVSEENPGNFMPSWNAGGRLYPFNNLDAIYGDKNVFSTCRDLLRYDSAIRHHVLLQPNWYDSAWTPNFPDKKYRDTIEYYGLGWRLKVFGGGLKIPYHNGWWHGNNAVFQRLVADSAVIIVTGNKFNRRIYSAGRAANIFRKYYLGEDDSEETEVMPGQGRAGSGGTPEPAATAVPSGRNRHQP